MFMKINNLDELRAFVLLYQEKSYTKVAARLKFSKAALSSKIKLLEEHLGFTLFERSTRTVMPTEDAHRFYLSSLKLLEVVKDLEESYSEVKKMEGKIHLTCSNSVAECFLGVILSEFMKLYPEIRIELTVTDSYLDLLEYNIDLAIRIGNLPSSSLYGKKMGENRLIFACSPSYLQNNPQPKNIIELKKHKISYLDIHEKLQFINSKVKLNSLGIRRDLLTNHSGIINQYGLEGGGIIVRSYWDIRKYIKSGQLLEIRLDDKLENYGDVWLLTTRTRFANLKVETLFRFIINKWRTSVKLL